MDTTKVVRDLSKDALFVLVTRWGPGRDGGPYFVNGLQTRLTQRAKAAYGELSGRRILTAIFGPDERFEAVANQKTAAIAASATAIFWPGYVGDCPFGEPWPVSERTPRKYDEECG